MAVAKKAAKKAVSKVLYVASNDKDYISGEYDTVAGAIKDWSVHQSLEDGDDMYVYQLIGKYRVKSSISFEEVK